MQISGKTNNIGHAQAEHRVDGLVPKASLFSQDTTQDSTTKETQ